MAEIPPSHAEQIRKRLLEELPFTVLTPHGIQITDAIIDAGLQAALKEKDGEIADLARMHCHSETNLQNMERRAMIAEAHAAALADRLTRIQELISRWTNRADDMERASDGDAWQGEMHEIRKCINELKQILALPQDGEARP